jgi:hypothetical protein
MDKDKMDKSRIRETMLSGIWKRLLDTEKLRSWAMNRMAKAMEKRTQPYESSPSFRKVFTFNDEKKQNTVARRSKTSKTDSKKPEEECVTILLGGAKASCGKKTTIMKTKSPTPKKALDCIFCIFFISFEKFNEFLKKISLSLL